jgi:hypothetical protein
MFEKVLLVSALSLAFAPGARAAGDLIITGIVDGPLSGGTPKAIELYAAADIGDLSLYGVGLANNGGGSDGEEFTLSGSTSAGSFLYITKDPAEFNAFFGFDANYTSSVAGGNGDDPVELFMNGSVVDAFGDVDLDGSGEPWEYTDGWAYRVDQTGPDGSDFILANWTLSGLGALSGETSNATALNAFPIGTYTASVVPIPAAVWLFGSAVLGLASVGRRRRDSAVC